MDLTEYSSFAGAWRRFGTGQTKMAQWFSAKTNKGALPGLIFGYGRHFFLWLKFVFVESNRENLGTYSPFF